MCTILFAYGVYDGFALASNRDEEYGRGFSAPERHPTDDGWYFAPTDDREGGTWLGFNDDGVVVTLSNLPDARGERSRGLLVADLLASPSVDAAVDTAEHLLGTDKYAGFNLVVGSAEGCAVVVNEPGEGHRVVVPDPGVGVVTNSPFDRPDEKARLVADAAPDPPDEPDDWLDASADVLSSHEPSVCVHDEPEGRGTTSSSLVYVPGDTDDAVFRFADGPPCSTAYHTSYTPAKEF